jgi:hypothetical protein
MRNFIILFDEKAGTSPLVRQLDKFESISILHQEDSSGFEPFDRHNCGRMSLRDLRKCLDIIYGHGPKNFEQLNRIYTRTAKRPLDEIDEKGVVGFKMRFTPPIRDPFRVIEKFAANDRLTSSIRQCYIRYFKSKMLEIFKRHDVVVLMAVRQDLLRLGLSIYHGDGTGKPGHLQFKMARGKFARDEIGKIRIDCERLGEIIATLEDLHSENRSLMEEIRRAGIQSHPILYEDFVADRRKYLESLFAILELNITHDEITHVLGQEEYLKKVHSDDISEFVDNHEEVMSRFADRFVSWR